MRVVTKHGLSVLNRRYQSVLIKCLLAGMVFLPRAANAYLNFDDATGILTVDQDSTLDSSRSVNEIAFVASEKFVLNGANNSLSAGDSGSIKISKDGTLQDLTMVGTVTGTGGNTATVAGKVTFNNATVSNINLDIMNGANLVMNGTMQDGKLSGGAAAYSEGGIFNNVDITTFFGTAKNATFKNDNSFAFNNVKFSGTTTIYADNVSGRYTNSKDPDHKNNLYAGEKLVLKSSKGNGAGTWDLGGNQILLFRGGAVQGNLKRGTLSFSDENSVFSGRLEDVTIITPTAESWNWNGNIQIDESSENVTLALGKDDAMVVPYTLTLTADANNISKVTINSDTTVNGNGHTLMANELHLSYFNAYFNNVTIKSGNDLTVSTGGGTLNLTNSSLSAANSITASNINVNGTLDVDLYATAGDTAFSADNITGENGAKVTFRTSGKSSDGNVYFNKKIEIKDVSLNFSGTKATFSDDVYFTNARISTTQRDTAFEFQGIASATFRGENTIVADKIKINDIGHISVDKNAGLTLKNIDGTGNGLLNGNLYLYGRFTGDMKGDVLLLDAGSDWSFSGKLNVGKVDALLSDGDTLDMSNLKLAAGSSIDILHLLSGSGSQSTSHMIVNSDLSVNELQIANRFTDARITGTGTLKMDKIVPTNYTSTQLTVYFDGINIAALNDDLDFTGVYLGKTVFTNNAISAANRIGIASDADFNGNSSLTAQTISVAKATTINGTLTVNGKLVSAGGITGGTLTMNGRLVTSNITDSTLNLVLPSVADPISEGAIVMVSDSVSNVNLNLDLKNVKGKNAQQYFVVDELHYGKYTISGSYGKYAFSSDGAFTLDDWKANKDKYLLSNVWGNSKGKLWILKVAGGAESAINDLRMAGIYVSPTEENASKILDLINDNPFADRLTDLLDSGNAGLQKQALREIAPTDAAASAFKTAKSAANAVMNAVSGRLGGASSDVSGRSGGDLTAGESVAWAQGMFNRAKMTGGDGFTSGTAGFSAGVERNATDEIKAGFGYAFASTGIKTGRSKINADTHTGFVYGEYAPDALYVNAMLGYGRSDYDDKAKLSGMKNSYKADTFSARVAAGYDMGTLTPEAALRFTAVRQNAYTDDLGARVSAKNLNTTTAVVGAKAGKDFAAGKYTVSPEMKAALTYDLARPNESRMVALPDGSNYVAAGEHLNRLGVEVGAKAAVRLTNEVELSLSYDGAFKEHYQDHTGLINVKVDF